MENEKMIFKHEDDFKAANLTKEQKSKYRN